MLALNSHGFGNVADLNHYFSRADNPLSLPGRQESTGVDYCASDRTEPLPGKSASEKEQERLEHCFSQVNHIREKLEKRGLLEEKGDGTINVMPDAGEKIRDFFSSALTAITSIGGKSGAVKPKDLACGLIFGCSTGMVVAGAMAFAFNKVVSALATAFPSYRPYFDNAGKLVYYLLSADHALINAAQSFIHEAVAGESNEIAVAILASIEILLGIYAGSNGMDASFKWAEMCLH
ncbi:MAG: hypothetical protein ABWY05_18195 [Noviherbaspirillum sp.]